MILRANCKINLGLDVLRRRDDGYHELETVMVPVRGLADEVEGSPLLAKVSHMKLPVPESFLQLVCSKFSASDIVNVVYRKYDGDWYDLRMEIYSTKRHVSYYPDIEKNRPDALITDSNHFKGLLYDVLSKDYGSCAGRVMPELGCGFVLQLIIRKNKIRRVKGIIFTQDGTPVQK